ncbi:hypothetical protein BXT95_15260 [Escherichia coli]|nr:hypothetical protein BXT95_15260 [Escherichia coli]
MRRRDFDAKLNVLLIISAFEIKTQKKFFRGVAEGKRPCQGRGREFESRFPLQNLKSAAKHRPPNRSISNCDKAATERILGSLQK